MPPQPGRPPHRAQIPVTQGTRQPREAFLALSLSLEEGWCWRREREDSSDCLLFWASGFMPSTCLHNNYHPRLRPTLYGNVYPNVKELYKKPLCTGHQPEKHNRGSCARGGSGGSANQLAPTRSQESIVKFSLIGNALLCHGEPRWCSQSGHWQAP